MCKKDIFAYPYELRRGINRRFCSRRCRKIGMFTIHKRRCQQCSLEFITPIKYNNTKFCSLNCAQQAHKGQGNGNYKEKIGYWGVHRWLSNYYGKADRCDNLDCVYPRHNSHGKILLSPKRFDWAKLKEATYTRNRDNFVRLCSSCHNKYDKDVTDIRI